MKDNVTFEEATETWTFRDDSDNVIMRMDNGDVFHVLDNMTDEDRALAVFGWMVVRGARDSRLSLFWHIADWCIFQ